MRLLYRQTFLKTLCKTRHKASTGIIPRQPYILLWFITIILKRNTTLTLVIISDCLQHDTIAVYLYQTMLIMFLKQALPFPLKKIMYFCDGATSQYKNRKNFLNLCHHEMDFGVKAEWKFSATSHGKGACDGLGGTVKRLAFRDLTRSKL